MEKKQSIINFSRRIIHTNSIIFYTSFFYHRKDKQTPRIVQINPKKNAILWEGTEKVPFGIKDLKNFFKTIF